MTEPSIVRFAVGDFSGWDPACRTLDGLRDLGVADRAIHILGLARLFADHSLPMLRGLPRALELAYRGEPGPVCCTPGVLADCLAYARGAVAESLGDALSRWMVPDAAGRIRRSVGDGLLLVWVQVSDADDERRACTGLLTYCLTGVEVHDLASRHASGNGRNR